MANQNGVPTTSIPELTGDVAEFLANGEVDGRSDTARVAYEAVAAQFRSSGAVADAINALIASVGAIGGDPEAIEAAFGAKADVTGSNVAGDAAVSFRTQIGAAPLYVTADGTLAERTVQSRFADFVSPLDFGALGDNVADDDAAVTACHDALGFVNLPAGKTFKISSLAKRLVSGLGALAIAGTVVSGFHLSFDPVYGQILCTPRIYSEEKSGLYSLPYVGPDAGNPNFSNIIIAPGANLTPTGRLWRNTWQGYGVGTLAQSVELSEIYGHEAFKCGKYGERLSLFGSNNGQWFGQDLTTDPVGRSYRHPLFWNGTDVVDPAVDGLTRFNMEHLRPGAGAAVAAMTAWATSRHDVARIVLNGRDAGLAIVKAWDIGAHGYRAFSMGYQGNQYVAAYGPYALQSGVEINKATACGPFAGETWQVGEGSGFFCFQAGSGVVKTVDSFFGGRNSAYGVWEVNRSVILGPYAAQLLPGYTTIGGTALEDAFILANDVGSTVPLLSGGFRTRNGVAPGLGVRVQLDERLATFHVRTAASGLTAVAVGASQGLFEGDTTAGVTIAGTEQLTLSFARPAITVPATVAERTYAAYIRAAQDASTGIDDLLFGLNGSTVGRWRQGGHLLIARSSELTSQAGAGYVFNANGQAEFFRTGSGAQKHIGFWNESGTSGALAQVGSIISSGSKFILRANTTERIAMDATGLGFFGATPVAKPTVTGSWGGNSAGQSLAAALASLGLIINSTTA